MSTTESTAQHANCRICGSSIVNQGRGWYHAGHPTVGYPGHYAERAAEPVTA